ncbi:MAG: glycosyltransferase family 39 protein, partial [Salibacteraceae bacterium]
MDRKLKITVGLIFVLVISLNVAFAPGNIISWDVYGYYLYLPTTFIYGDLGLDNYDQIVDLMHQYNSSGTFYQAHGTDQGNYVMKYSMGMAILYLPFFLLGGLGAILFDFPLDGFSWPFQMAINMGSILYSLLGIWYLAKVLNHFFSWKVSSLVLLLLTLGTNYMVHVTMYGQNAMSQNYLFTGYAIMLWLTITWHKRPTLKNSIGIGVLGGLMTLSRPTEIVVFLIPLLWNVWSWESLVSKAKFLQDHYYKVIVMVVIVGLIGSLQLIYWKIFTGSFLYNSYGNNAGEGMELLSPYLNKFLFSFRKGWLVYTPMMLFSIAGIIAIWKKNRFIFFSLLGFLLVNVYFISSWSNWWYAQSFSQRAMVSSYPVMAVGLGYFLVWLKDQETGLKVFISFLILIALGLNVFQTAQFNRGIIDGDRMTKEAYLASFGKLTKPDDYDRLLLVNRSVQGKEGFKYRETYSNKVLAHLNFNDSDGELGYTGCCSMVLDSSHLYTPAIESSYQEITQKDHVWFRISAWVYVEEEVKQNEIKIVAHFEHNGFIYDYNVHNINPDNLVLGQWNEIELYHLSPEVRKKKNRFKSYVWYTGSSRLLVDDLRVEVFE